MITGKTHTMYGNGSEDGIIEMAIEQLFFAREVKYRGQKRILCSLSHLSKTKMNAQRSENV